MSPPPLTRWTAPEPDLKAEEVLTRELRVHPLTARLLVNRRLTDPAAADAFLRPGLHHLHDPFGLPDMDRAARRIVAAIQNGETIFIHGDYDVDGVTSTAVYVRALTALGAKLLYKVPHRKNDGYDLKIGGRLIWSREQGASLVDHVGLRHSGARSRGTYANSLGAHRHCHRSP